LKNYLQIWRKIEIKKAEKSPGWKILGIDEYEYLLDMERKITLYIVVNYITRLINIKKE
jgi:hypothetical protein